MANEGDITARYAQCKALAEHAPPMTDQQKAERRTLIAREYARAEARRRPPPQFDLDLAA